MEHLHKTTAKALVKALSEGKVVDFYFIKKDGSLRHAVGTKDAELFQEDMPQGKREPNKGVITFYDLSVKGWRSVKETADVFIRVIYKHKQYGI